MIIGSDDENLMLTEWNNIFSIYWNFKYFLEVSRISNGNKIGSLRQGAYFSAIAWQINFIKIQRHRQIALMFNVPISLSPFAVTSSYSANRPVSAISNICSII
jgi:hypothetical protein